MGIDNFSFLDDFTLDNFSRISCAIIVAVFFAAWIYVASTNSDKFSNRKKWIEQLPSVVSTLGVLGTFLGITKGLVNFNPNDLDNSIPQLLEGLKTAFFTSLLGMTGSLVLNRIVSHKFDKEENHSDAEKAARLLMDSLPAILSKSNKDLVNVLSQDITIKTIREDVEQLKDDIEEIKGHVEDLKNSSNAVVEELPRLRAVTVTATASISAIDNNIDEINETLTILKKEISEIKENVENIKSKDEENL